MGGNVIFLLRFFLIFEIDFLCWMFVMVVGEGNVKCFEVESIWGSVRRRGNNYRGSKSWSYGFKNIEIFLILIRDIIYMVIDMMWFFMWKIYVLGNSLCKIRNWRNEFILYCLKNIMWKLRVVCKVMLDVGVIF